MIFAVSLIEFDYTGELFSDYCLYKSFSLEKAKIYTFPDNTSVQNSRRMYRLLIGLSNVKELRLSSEVVEVWLLLSL